MPAAAGHTDGSRPASKAVAVGVEAARRPSMEAVAGSVDAAATAFLAAGGENGSADGVIACGLDRDEAAVGGTAAVDGARMHLHPLRVAELFELLLVKELSAGCRADPHLLEYLKEEAPLHPPRPAPPSSTAAAATVDEEMQRAVDLYARSHASIARARRHQQGPPSAATPTALVVVAPPQVVLDLPLRRPGRIVATTANLRCLDAGRFHLSSKALEALVRLVPLCVNLERLGLQQQANADEEAVTRPLCGTVARSHPTLTALDLTGTLVGWDDLRALHVSMQRNVRLRAVSVDHALCETPPTLQRKLAAQEAFNDRAMANAAVAVRGSFAPEALVSGLGHVTRDDLECIFVPWQV